MEAEVSTHQSRVIVVRNELEQTSDDAETIELALVYFPGALIPSESYVTLAKSLQDVLRSARVKLHVAIAAAHRGMGDLLCAAFTPGGYSRHHFDACLAALRHEASFTPRVGQLFIAGHSMGGLHACISAMECTLPTEEASQSDAPNMSNHGLAVCAGVILHGSYATTTYLATPNCPPVATILGDRDGLVRLSHTATHRRDHVRPLTSSISEEVTRTPLVILPGISHTSFTAGASTGYVHARDLHPAIPASAALASIAAATAAFILMTACSPSTPAAPSTFPRMDPGAERTPATQHRAHAAHSAATFLAHHLQHDSAHYLRPYTDALQRDLDGSTCMDAQRELIAVASAPGVAIAVQMPTLMHEQEPRWRAPRALRRDALAKTTPTVGAPGPACTGRSRHGLQDLEAGSGDGAEVSVRPCAALTLRRHPGFRMSVPAAPTRLRCKLVAPATARAAQQQQQQPVAAQQERPAAAGVGAGAAGAAATEPAERDGAMSQHACERVTDHPAPSHMVHVELQHMATAEGGPDACAPCMTGGARVKEAQTQPRVKVVLRVIRARAQAGGPAVGGGARARVGAYAAARMNRATMQRVLDKLPAHIRELYCTSPRRLQFGVDMEARSRTRWLHASLRFEDAPALGTSAAHAPAGSKSSQGRGGGEGGRRASRHAGRVVDGAVRPSLSHLDRREQGAREGGVVLRSPRCTAGGDGVQCYTLLSEAQAYEYVLYGSQTGGTIGVEGGVLARAAGGGAAMVQPDIWRPPAFEICSATLP